MSPVCPYSNLSWFRWNPLASMLEAVPHGRGVDEVNEAVILKYKLRHLLNLRVS
jgi:hypothetical protein